MWMYLDKHTHGFQITSYICFNVLSIKILLIILAGEFIQFPLWPQVIKMSCLNAEKIGKVLVSESNDRLGLWQNGFC